MSGSVSTHFEAQGIPQLIDRRVSDSCADKFLERSAKNFAPSILLRRMSGSVSTHFEVQGISTIN